jgi:hypothetical protein
MSGCSVVVNKEIPTPALNRTPVIIPKPVSLLRYMRKELSPRISNSTELNCCHHARLYQSHVCTRQQFRSHIPGPRLHAEEGKVLTSSGRKTREICQVISHTASQPQRLAVLSSLSPSEAGVSFLPTARTSVWLWTNRLPVPGLKPTKPDADQSHPSNAEVKNAWLFTSTRLYVFKTWCLDTGSIIPVFLTQLSKSI